MSPVSFANAMASRGRGVRLLAISADLSPSESSSAAQVRYLPSPAWREGAEQPQLQCQTVGENDANRPGRWPLSNSVGHAGQWYSLAWLEYCTDAGRFKPEPVERYSGEVQTDSLPKGVRCFEQFLTRRLRRSANLRPWDGHCLKCLSPSSQHVGFSALGHRYGDGPIDVGGHWGSRSGRA